MFRLNTRSVLSQAQAYLCGLIQAARRNVERMAEVVPGTDAQALHHFLSKSPWDPRPVMDQVAQDLDALVGGDQDTCLLLDETCFRKKGTKSVRGMGASCRSRSTGPGGRPPGAGVEGPGGYGGLTWGVKWKRLLAPVGGETHLCPSALPGESQEMTVVVRGQAARKASGPPVGPGPRVRPRGPGLRPVVATGIEPGVSTGHNH